jgi:hypothetical protein
MSGSQLQSRSQTGSQSAASTPTSTQSPSFSSPPGAGVAFVTAFIKTGSGLDALTGGPLLPTLELAFASAGGAGAAMTTLSQLVDVASGETFARVSNGYYLPLGSRRQLATDSQVNVRVCPLVAFSFAVYLVATTCFSPCHISLCNLLGHTRLGSACFLQLDDVGSRRNGSTSTECGVRTRQPGQLCRVPTQFFCACAACDIVDTAHL